MKKNENRRMNGTTRRLRRIEDKLDVLLYDLRQMQQRANWLQSQIDSRNEMEMDLAIDRLHAATFRMNELAEKELQAVRERYGTPGI